MTSRCAAPRRSWPALLVVTAVALPACAGSGDDEVAAPPQMVAEGPEVTSAVLADDPRPSSQVSTDAPKVASSVEVRVGEILSRLDTSTTDEGTVITLPELVLFDFDRAELKPEASATLAEIAEVIAFYQDAPVAIRGHTDDVGSEAYNDNLSERRSDAVATNLVDTHGVDQARLAVSGLGERRPVAPNAKPDGSDNPDGRAQNRRVEVVIEGVSPPPAG